MEGGPLAAGYDWETHELFCTDIRGRKIPGEHRHSRLSGILRFTQDDSNEQQMEMAWHHHELMQ
jgi:hypothetical protein